MSLTTTRPAPRHTPQRRDELDAINAIYAMTIDKATGAIMQATASDSGNSREAVRGILEEFAAFQWKSGFNTGITVGAAEARKPSERCEVCNTELSQCGPQGVDGEPSMDCLVCKLRDKLADAHNAAIQSRDFGNDTKRLCKLWHECMNQAVVNKRELPPSFEAFDREIIAIEQSQTRKET